MIFFVTRGCVIFFCLEVAFFCSESLCDFRVKRLLHFFLPRRCVTFCVPRGWVTVLCQEVA